MPDKKKNFDSPEDLDEFMSGEPEGAEEEGFADEPEKPAHEAAPAKAAADEPPEVMEEEKGESVLDSAGDVPVQVVAVMGKKNITLKELAGLRMGEVIELNRPASEVVDLVAGGRLIAKGELVEVEGKLGVKVVKMVR